MDMITRIEQEVADLSEGLTSHIEEGIIRETEMAIKMESISNKVDDLTATVKSLLAVWEQTQGVLSFVKWLFGISGSIVALIAFFKGAKG